MAVHTCEIFLFARINDFAYGDEEKISLRPSFNEEPFYDGEFLVAKQTVAMRYIHPNEQQASELAVESLEKAVSKERAASALRVRDLEDRIARLLALPAPGDAE